MRDQPRPGHGLVALICLAALTTGGAIIAVVFDLRDEGVLTLGLMISLFCVPMAALPLLLLHAVYRTVYVFQDDVLRLRAGLVIRSELPYVEIVSVKPWPMISNVIGWGRLARALANRMPNGLEITMESKMRYYITPSDPAAFAKQLPARIQAR